MVKNQKILNHFIVIRDILLHREKDLFIQEIAHSIRIQLDKTLDQGTLKIDKTSLTHQK